MGAASGSLYNPAGDRRISTIQLELVHVAKPSSNLTRYTIHNPLRIVYCVLPGQWGESDKIFVALIDEFTNQGHPKDKVSLTFEVDQVTFKIREGGMLVGTLSGRVEE